MLKLLMLLCDIHLLRKLADFKGANIFRCNGTINLEKNHEIADACTFSSCKGLGGLTGASFVTYKNGVIAEIIGNLPFTMELETHINNYIQVLITQFAHCIQSHKTSRK